MMRRLSAIPLSVLVLGTAVLPRVAEAETIMITGGELTGESFGGRVRLIGGTRFFLEGSGDITGGIFFPAGFCRGLPDVCSPGQTLSLLARWSDSDFTGRATLDGTTYPLGMRSETTSSAFVDFDGSVLLPAFTGATQVSVFAPFSFNGQFSLPDTPPGGPNTVPIFLLGSGTARLDLVWNPSFGGAWDFQGAQYQFEAAADPVPEPTTMLLVGSGIAGCAAATRRRRRVSQPG